MKYRHYIQMAIQILQVNNQVTDEHVQSKDFEYA